MMAKLFWYIPTEHGNIKRPPRKQDQTVLLILLRELIQPQRSLLARLRQSLILQPAEQGQRREALVNEKFQAAADAGNINNKRRCKPPFYLIAQAFEEPSLVYKIRFLLLDRLYHLCNILLTKWAFHPHKYYLNYSLQ